MLYAVLFSLFLSVTPVSLGPNNIIRDNKGRAYMSFTGRSWIYSHPSPMPQYDFEPTVLDENVNSITLKFANFLSYFKNNNFNTLYGLFSVSNILVDDYDVTFFNYTPVSYNISHLNLTDPVFGTEKLATSDSLVIYDKNSKKIYVSSLYLVTEGGVETRRRIQEYSIPNYTNSFKQFIYSSDLSQILMIDNNGDLYYTGFEIGKYSYDSAIVPTKILNFPHKIEKLYSSFFADIVGITYKEKVTKKNYLLLFNSPGNSTNFLEVPYQIIELPFSEDIKNTVFFGENFCLLTNSGSAYCSLGEELNCNNANYCSPVLSKVPFNGKINKLRFFGNNTVVFLDQNKTLFLYGENPFANLLRKAGRNIVNPYPLVDNITDFESSYIQNYYMVFVYLKNNTLYSATNPNLFRRFLENQNNPYIYSYSELPNFLRVPNIGRSHSLYQFLYSYNSTIVKDQRTKGLFYLFFGYDFNLTSQKKHQQTLTKLNSVQQQYVNTIVYNNNENQEEQTIILTALEKVNTVKTKKIVKYLYRDSTSVFLTNEKKLYLWGKNSFYQSGNGTNTNIFNNPVLYPVPNIVDFVTSNYANTVIALDQDGNVWCSGYNGLYNCGQGNTSTVTTPSRVKTGPSSYLTGVKKIFSVAKHTLCAQKTDDTFWCWGQNSSGQLCTGNYNNFPYATQMTFTIGGQPQKVVDAHGQMCNSCYTSYYLLENGKVYACGDNTDGVMGTGGTEAAYNTPQEVPLPEDGVFSLSIADDNACYVDSSKNAWCVGQDRGHFSSVFGVSYNDNPVTPMGSEYNTVKIQTTKDAMCYITKNGKLWCSGPNQYGLGFSCNGFTCDSAIPETVVDVSMGEKHACAITSSFKLYCWGNNQYGQLGNGTSTKSNLPVLVKSNESFNSVSVGADHTCAISLSGAAYCWGNNQYGQLGVKGISRATRPVPVQSAYPYLKIYASDSFTCAITGVMVPSKTVIRCWGLNNVGQLGTGNTKSSSEPIDVITSTTLGPLTLNKAQYLSTGKTHVCAHLKDSTGVSRIVCWGKNSPIFNEAKIPNNYTPKPFKILENTEIDYIVGGDKTLCVQNNTKQLIGCFGNKKEVSYIY